MHMTNTIPGCCSVGNLHDLYDWNGTGIVPECNSLSGTFVAVFNAGQKKAFDKVCKKHDLISCTWAKGGHTDVKYIAICVFGKKGTGKDNRYGAKVAEAAKQPHWMN